MPSIGSVILRSSLTATVLAGAAACEVLAADPSHPAPTLSSDARREISIPDYGIAVRVPLEWAIAEQEHDERAFVLFAPRHDGDRPGVVACEIGVAPSSLEDYRSRIAARAERESKDRSLIQNEVRKSDGRSWLDVEWKFVTPDDGPWHERKVFCIENGHLYTFVLSADASHVEKVRPEFDAMVQDAAFSPPDTRVLPMPQGFWMQRDLRFGLKLPEGWKPAFSPSEKAQLFAVGKVDEILTDNLIVVAGPQRPLDFEKLEREYPREIARIDPASKVLRCETIQQGAHKALETVVETQRGPFRITILERRFHGARLGYEVKYTVLSEHFEELAEAIRKSAASFKEFPSADESDML